MARWAAETYVESAQAYGAKAVPANLFSALCLQKILFGEGVALLTILSCSMVETSCAIPPRGGITGVMVANLTGHLLPWISSNDLRRLRDSYFESD